MHLETYKTGDGSLGFVWITNSGEVGGRTVKEEHLAQLIREEAKYRDCEIVEIPIGEVRLVKKLYRLNAVGPLEDMPMEAAGGELLLIDNKHQQGMVRLRYSFDPLKVETAVKGSDLRVEHRLNGNWTSKLLSAEVHDAVRFFLNNEKFLAMFGYPAAQDRRVKHGLLTGTDADFHFLATGKMPKKTLLQAA